ncbi:MAG: uncharacterized protein K0R61_4687 [Microvirga sp.]|nr:uncharacterized protein [Microvirga sp.]
MPAAVSVRTDFSAGELRRLATAAKNASQSRRRLSLAAVLAGMNRAQAARIGGMDRQTRPALREESAYLGPAKHHHLKRPGRPGSRRSSIKDEGHWYNDAIPVQGGELPAHRERQDRREKNRAPDQETRIE